MNIDTYVAYLLVGVVLIIADGQLLYRNGRRYLVSAYGGDEGSASVGRLVAGVFYLAMLGLLALVSTMDVPVNGSLPEFVTRIGVLLLILAAGHGITTWILAALRRRQEDQRLSEKVTEQFDLERGRALTVDRSSSSAGGYGESHTTIGGGGEPARPVYTPSGRPYVAPSTPGPAGDNAVTDPADD